MAFRARESLGWQPRTHLNVGLRATVAYFRRQLEENRPAAAERRAPFVPLPIAIAQRPVPDCRPSPLPNVATNKLPHSLG